MKQALVKTLLAILFSLAVISTFCAALCVLNKTGSFILIWQQDELNGIRHEAGFGAYARIPNENTASLNLPLLLLEDGVILENPPLGVNEDIALQIKEHGEGRYEVLENNNLFFSSTDGSNPADGQHEYSVLTPAVIRMRYLLPVLAIAIFIILILCVIWIVLLRKHNDGAKKVFNRQFSQAWVILYFLFLSLFLLPWHYLRAVMPMAQSRLGYLSPMLQRNVMLCVALFVMTVVYLRLCKNNRVINVLVSIIILTNSVCYFLPEWNYYGTRTDSASYLAEHQVDSIRTPGYVKFAETVLRKTADADLTFWRSARGRAVMKQNEDKLLQDFDNSSKGLVTLAQAQKIFLGICFLISCLMLAKCISPALVFIFAQLVLSGGFLGVYNSYIMSEVVSQALILLACVTFIYLVISRNEALYALLALLIAAAILVRPSNIFLALLILVALVVVLSDKSQIYGWPMILAGLAAFIWLVSIPAREIYSEYGRIVWMPVSGYAEIGRASALVTPDDIANAPSEQSKEFLTGVLEKTAQLKDEKLELEQNDYVWSIAVPQAAEMGYDAIESSWLFARVYPQIFAAHPQELFADIHAQLELAFTRTRLQFDRIPYLLLLVLFVVFAFIKASRLSMCGLLFLILHNVHLVISVINQPERRYIYSTEIVFILGAMLIIRNLVELRTHNEIRD